MTFDEWLKTKNGIESNDEQGIPIGQPYLRNRLWWAFEAGVESGEQDRRLQTTLEWYEGKLRECRTRNRKLKAQLNVWESRYSLEFQRDGNMYIVHAIEFPHITANGRTKKEAAESLMEDLPHALKLDSKPLESKVND